MKPIIVTYSNESWVMIEPFGTSYIAWQYKYEVYNIISVKDIKLIARPKK